MSDHFFDQALWAKGLRFEALLESMTVNHDAMLRRYQMVEITPNERFRLEKLSASRKLLILTEEWCSDCLMNLPILAKLTEATANLDIRFFIRKDWPELRTYFNDLNIFSLPTVQILDDQFTPLDVWMERPEAAHQRLAEWKESHPEVEHTRRRADLTSEQKKVMIQEINTRLIAEMEDWYASGLQSETVREIVEKLEALEPHPQGV